MGSLRKPVGPLPSSIYWRRRSLAAVLIVLVAALVAWVVTLGGGGGAKHDDRGGGPAPATSITPGPGGSGPAISQQPGGRDESDGGSDGTSGGGSGGAGGSGGDGGKNGDTAGAGGAGGAAGSGGSAGSAGSAGSVGSAGSGGAGGPAGAAGAAGAGGAVGGSGGAGPAEARQVAAGSTLPTCGKGALKVVLSSTKVAYEPDEKPQFRLMVTNSSGATCKVNLGPKAMVLTITNTDDDRIFTSKDCPEITNAYFEVPAHSTVRHTVTWDRRHSTTTCSTTTPPAAGAGTYLAQISSSVATIPQTQSEKSIRLDQD